MIQETLYIEALEKEFYIVYLNAEELKIKEDWIELNHTISPDLLDGIFSNALREAHLRSCFEVKEKLHYWKESLESLIESNRHMKGFLERLKEKDD